MNLAPLSTAQIRLLTKLKAGETVVANGYEKRTASLLQRAGYVAAHETLANVVRITDTGRAELERVQGPPPSKDYART